MPLERGLQFIDHGGGGPGNGPHRLDGDGVACASLPWLGLERGSGAGEGKGEGSISDQMLRSSYTTARK